MGEGVFIFGDFELDRCMRQLRRQGTPVPIEPKPFDLLVHLIRHRDRVVSKEELSQLLWPDVVVSESSLSSSVRRMRAALGASAELVQGLRKIGYRFVGEVAEAPVAASGAADTPVRAAPPTMSTSRSDEFIGRVDELGRLLAVLDGGLQGRGAFVALRGDPGVGKTRTIEEVAAAARQRGFEVLSGSCFEGEGGQVLWPWVQIFREFASRRSSASVAAVLGDEAGDVARLTAAIAAPSGAPARADPEMDRTRLLDSAIAVLRRVARREAALLLILEDLHWADSASIVLLQTLIGQVADEPLVIFGTYREGEIRADHPLATMLTSLRRDQRLVPVSLQGLNRAESEALIHSYAGAVVDQQSLQTIFAVTEGNPLFLREYWRYLVDEGVLVPVFGGWEPRGDALARGVPDSISEIIRRRSQRLGPECVQLLSVAAVVGREFSHQLLARVSALPIEKTIDLLDEAANAQVIQEVDDSVGEYRFVHALVRETLYDGLSGLRRAALHRYVGDALEASPGADRRERIADLAYHYLRGAAVGSTEKAIEYAERAAADAMQACAYDSAADHLARAVALCEGLPEAEGPAAWTRQCELHLRLAAAFERAGRAVAMRAAFDRAADLARRIPSPELLARAAAGMTLRWAHNDEPAIRSLEEVLTVLPKTEIAWRARAQARLAQALYLVKGMRSRREQLCREARVLAESSGDPMVIGEVLADCLEALFHGDQLAHQEEMTAALYAVAERAGDARLRLLARAWQVVNSMRRGKLHRADEQVSGLRRLAEEVRQPRFLSQAVAFEAALLLSRGRLQEAEERSNQALRIGLRGDPESAVWLNWNQIYLLRREQGRFLEMSEEGRRVRLPAGTKAAVSIDLLLPWALAHMLSDIGREEEARTNYENLVKLGFDKLPPDDGRNTRIAALFSVAEVCGTVGDQASAETLYQLALPYIDQWQVVGWGGTVLTSTHQVLGILRSVQQRWDEADEHFEEAMRQHAEQGAVTAQARTYYQHARSLRRRGRRTDLARAQHFVQEGLRLATEFGLGGVGARLQRLVE